MRTLFAEFLFVLLSGAAVLDRVAVVVGNAVLTEGEVDEELRLEQFTASQPLDVSPQQRRAAADRLVDQQLIRQELQVSHYKTPEPAKADAMLAMFRQEHYRSDADLRAALQKYGLTEDELKQYLLWQLTAIQFTDERFHPTTQTAPESSANREIQPPAPSPKPVAPPTFPPTESADRLVPGANSVDQELDAWLKQARAATRVQFKEEAFQ